LEKFYPNLPPEAYESAIKKITEISVAKSTLQINQEKYDLYKNGVLVSFRNEKGEIEDRRIRVFDFENPEANHFLVVRELWVQGWLYRRRPDIIGFVNGIPLLFIELKNIHKDIRRAYNENLSDYKDTIPHIFDHNAFVVLSNGDRARLGSISSKYEHFHEWKRLAEEDPGVVDLETMLAEKRLDAIARDFVQHYTTRWETGKAMLVCIDKITTVRMFNLIQPYWQERIREVEAAVKSAGDEQEEVYLRRQLNWLQETEMAVVVSEEQGEVKRFQEWGLDIIPHRKKIKDGFETADGKRIDLDTAFKKDDQPFRIAIICAMWLTGFDVESLATLYLDKPLKAHTLMQAIARANRVYEGKNNGLIVDYCGILKNLRAALATFATGGPGGGDGRDPVKPEEELIEDLREAIDMVKAFLKERGFNLRDITVKEGFKKIESINHAREIINQSEETRKRFEILAREVFKKFKACLTIKAVYDYKKEHEAIEMIYKKLQDDQKKADITEVIREMQAIVDDVIAPVRVSDPDESKIYDISKIDFNRLKEEFKKYPRKNTTMQSLKCAVEQRLKRMLERNPLRTDFYKRYQEVISDYNYEKDRLTIEETFAALLKFVEELDNEEKRAVREGLDEENLALFDILLKPELSTRDRSRIKKVAKDLLAALKAEKLRIDNWREKETTKAAVKTFIYDFLWNEETGLPLEFYTPEEVAERTDLVFTHVFRQYTDALHHAYAT